VASLRFVIYWFLSIVCCIYKNLIVYYWKMNQENRAEPAQNTDAIPAVGSHTTGLGLLGATNLIAGSMIGSGIFIVPAMMATELNSVGLLLLAWLITGIMTIFGALSYGELAAAMPTAGGQYVYLRRIYGPLTGFLYGWTLFAVIQTGTIAAVAVAFARFLGSFVPQVSEQIILVQIGDWSVSSAQLVGLMAVGGLSLLNFRGLQAGAAVQNTFTITKIAALVVIIVVGIFAGLGGSGDTANFIPFWGPALDMTWTNIVVVLAVAMVGSLFSADAWNNVTFMAGEIRNPQRNLPLSLLIGTGTVLSLYFLVNVIYVYILGINGIAQAPSERVGTAMMEAVLGPTGQLVMAGLIVISTFGCLNGLILAGARVYRQMAIDGFFLPIAAKLNSHQAPAKALMLQGVWSAALVMSGSYGQLLNYVIFAVLLFYILTVAGVIVLRKQEPALARPYRVAAYPWIPAIYVVLAVIVSAVLLVQKSATSVMGLVLVLSGVPIFLYLAMKKKANAAK
jgi:basic amino acid/polyamine antiporter, APA family